jgi:hypothetical protein
MPPLRAVNRHVARALDPGEKIISGTPQAGARVTGGSAISVLITDEATGQSGKAVRALKSQCAP